MPTGIYIRTEEHKRILKELSNRPRKPRGGGYDAIHKWLKNNYGKADLCENKDCAGKSQTFVWAKKPKVKYKHKRENFHKLCQSCHMLQDRTEEWTRNNAIAKTGTKLTPEHKLAISKGLRKYHDGTK